MPKKKTSSKKNSALPKLLFTKKCSEIPTKKRWDSYADYLKSPEWKQIKKDFVKNNPDWGNVCEISGMECDGGERPNLHFHHWHYPKDWNDDSWENLILVCKEVHDFIHSGKDSVCEILKERATLNRSTFKAALLRDYGGFMFGEAGIYYFKYGIDNKQIEKIKFETRHACLLSEMKQLDELAKKDKIKNKRINIMERSLCLALDEIDRLRVVNNG